MFASIEKLVNLRGRFLVILSFSWMVTACTLPLVWATEPPPLESSPSTLAPGPSPTFPIPLPTDEISQPAIPTLTASPLPSTVTPNPTATPQPVPFILQPGSRVAVGNFGRPDLGCNWLGVAGQVFDAQGRPKKSLVVELGGRLAGVQLNAISVSGGATAYGPAGYEITLAQRPLGSQGTVWVQLFDLSGEALSDKVYFDTFNDCQRNLILVNFLELATFQAFQFLPLVSR